jgi:hypothetical protein
MTIPIILVAGFSQAARHRVVRQLLKELSDAEMVQVAWLDHQDSLTSLDPADTQPTQSFVACVCCAGSVVFTTYLARTLRQGTWAALIVSLGARAEPQKMLRLLGDSPWKEHLGPARLFSVMDDIGLALCSNPSHPMHHLACQQRDCAEQVLQPGNAIPLNLLF